MHTLIHRSNAKVGYASKLRFARYRNRKILAEIRLVLLRRFLPRNANVLINKVKTLPRACVDTVQAADRKLDKPQLSPRHPRNEINIRLRHYGRSKCRGRVNTYSIGCTRRRIFYWPFRIWKCSAFAFVIIQSQSGWRLTSDRLRVFSALPYMVISVIRKPKRSRTEAADQSGASSKGESLWLVVVFSAWMNSHKKHVTSRREHVVLWGSSMFHIQNA